MVSRASDRIGSKATQRNPVSNKEERKKERKKERRKENQRGCTRLVKPTEIAVLNKDEHIDPRLLSGRSVQD